MSREAHRSSDGRGLWRSSYASFAAYAAPTTPGSASDFCRSGVSREAHRTSDGIRLGGVSSASFAVHTAPTNRRSPSHCLQGRVACDHRALKQKEHSVVAVLLLIRLLLKGAALQNGDCNKPSRLKSPWWDHRRHIARRAWPGRCCPAPPASGTNAPCGCSRSWR